MKKELRMNAAENAAEAMTYLQKYAVFVKVVVARSHAARADGCCL